MKEFAFEPYYDEERGITIYYIGMFFRSDTENGFGFQLDPSLFPVLTAASIQADLIFKIRKNLDEEEAYNMLLDSIDDAIGDASETELSTKLVAACALQILETEGLITPSDTMGFKVLVAFDDDTQIPDDAIPVNRHLH